MIRPATRKTTIRGPSASTASRRLPGPRSSRLVTTDIAPAPAGVIAPAPSAPGNAGTPASAGESPRAGPQAANRTMPRTAGNPGYRNMIAGILIG